ncbi:MAG: Trm112 family protein [Archaeoglobaceae archaeon]|nr:Trm112 family protein [Archaeoglobaceae archaeon]MCX8151706.1 Trm112 family protein [Archaeoglobaceae archaeon]MDW8013016.1 Trm112 family protein [Archaeoglobaceae archaeon]
MRKKLLDIICCPKCRGDLELTAEETKREEIKGVEEEIIITGKLVCKNCGKIYPIKDEIPYLLVEEV